MINMKKVRHIRASFIAPQQNSEYVMLFDGWKSFNGSTEQHHCMVLEHTFHHFIEVIIYNERLNIEAPRIYLNTAILTASFPQTEEVQEKFNDIRKLLVLQKQKIQILQYINARMTIPKFELSEEFSCILIPRSDDDPSLLEGDIQFQKPRELEAFLTNRCRNETYQEGGFSQALINWRREVNATCAAHAKSSAYQMMARTAIDGFKHRAQIETESLSALAESGGKAPPSAAKVHWMHGLRKVQTRIFVKSVKERLSLDSLGAGKPMFRRQQSSSFLSTSSTKEKVVSPSLSDDVNADHVVEVPAPPLSAYDQFYSKLSSLQLEMPLTVQSTDRAAYLEELTASVIGLFCSNLEQLHRVQSQIEHYSPARQRWIRAFRKVNMRNYTAKLRLRLDCSSAIKSQGQIYLSPAEMLQRRITERQQNVEEITLGDAQAIRKVEQLLGTDWLSCEEDFFARLTALNREMVSLNVYCDRADYLQGLTAIVVNTFSRHLQRLRKSNSDFSRVRRLWIRAIDKVRARNCTAKMRTRLLRSPSGRDLLGAKQRLKDARALMQLSPASPVSPRGSPSMLARRHTRRDDIELRDLPPGYIGSSSPSASRKVFGGDKLHTSALNGTSSAPLPRRGIEKTHSADDAAAEIKKAARRSLPSRLQRQGGLGKMAILNSSSAKEFEDGGSVRSSRGSSVFPSSGLLVKSASSNATNMCTNEVSPSSRDSPSRSTPSTLLKRLADPFTRPRPQSAAVDRSSSSDVLTSSLVQSEEKHRLSINSSAGTDNERDSFDSRDHDCGMLLSTCGSMDSVDYKAPAPSAMSPSLMYHRLVSSGVGRPRTHSGSDSMDEDGCASPAALRRSAKGKQPSSPMTRPHVRIVPINITAELETDHTLRSKTFSDSNIFGGDGFAPSLDTISNHQNSFLQADGYLSVSNETFDLKALSGKVTTVHLQHQQQLQWMKLKPASPASKASRPSSAQQTHHPQMPRGFPSLHLNTSHHDMSSGNLHSQESPLCIADLSSPVVPLGVQVQHRGSGGYFPRPSTTQASHSSEKIDSSPAQPGRGMPPTSPCNPRLLHSNSIVRSLPGSSSPGGSTLNKRFDTMGDIARKYNIDPLTSSSRTSGSGGGAMNNVNTSSGSSNGGGGAAPAVPRYAQSTIKSMIRDSIVQSDKL